MALATCETKMDGHGRELAEHGTVSFPVACYEDDLEKAGVPWHWHNALEAVVVAEGRAIVAISAEKHIVEAGCGFFINAGALHGVWAADAHPCRLHSVVFHPRLIGGSDSVFWQKYLQPLLDTPSLKSMFFDGSSPWMLEARNAIESAWQAYAAAELGYEFQMRAALSQLIFLLSGHNPAAQNHPTEKALRDGERIKVMLCYIQAHYAEEISAAQIAQSAMISESECLRCFRRTIGVTPTQYSKRFRIQKAMELLASTGQSVADIGAACGFREMSYFAKTFRELQGCTPSAYRRQQKEAVSV